MMTNLFVGACLLIGALSAGVPPAPSLNVPETDRLSCDDSMSGRTVEEVRSDGVQSSLVALHLMGELPETRQDLIRLATGESFVRPTAFTRVTVAPGTNALTMDVEIGDDSSDDSSLHGKQRIDAALGIRPSPQTAPDPVPNADQTASAGVPPTVPMPGTLNPEIGRNDFPVESLHLMNETLTTHRFSRNGPANPDVYAALSRMDIGKDATRIWQRLDEYVTTDSHTQCHKIEVEACEIANRLCEAQVGLAEAVYRREWNDEWAPILSLLIPGTRGGGLSGCRFEHPDEPSNGPMSSPRLRMHSLGINTVQNGPNECMLETGWYCMSRAERMFLEEGN